MNNKRFVCTRVISLLLVIIFILPMNAFAVEQRASDYLESYSAYIYPSGWGKVQVWFTVTGTNYMDQIGALSIWLYESTDNENWTLVETYKAANNVGMLANDEFLYSGHVEYGGTIGRYYKAYVCIWAGKDNGGDNRYIWTLPVQATLFAG